MREERPRTWCLVMCIASRKLSFAFTSPSSCTYGQGFRVQGKKCSGSEAGSYLRLIDLVYHSTLGLRVIKKKKKVPGVEIRGEGMWSCGAKL